jgi:hypothetical protein
LKIQACGEFCQADKQQHNYTTLPPKLTGRQNIRVIVHLIERFFVQQDISLYLPFD